MQVKASKSWNMILLLGLVSCASSSKFNWPEANPFSNFPYKNLSDASEGRVPFRVVFASNVMGEIEPCGCAVGPKGGLDRRANFIKNEVHANDAQWPALVVDAGNALLPTPRIDAARVEAYQEVARGLLKAHRDMGVQVQNVGYLDVGFGIDFLKKEAAAAKLPLVSASWRDAVTGEALFDASKTIVLSSGLNVTVVGLSAGLQGARPDLDLTVEDPKKALGDVLKQTPKENVVVVLSDLGQPVDESLAQHFSSHALIFVGSRDLGGLSLPKQTKKSLMVQGQFRGQQWGVVDAYLKTSSAGWVFLDQIPYFERLWSNLVARRKMDQGRLKQSRELSLEETRHAHAARDLMSYSPADYEKKSIYSYRLIDLDDRYRQTNEFTPVMNRLIKIKQ
jgi:2',3'-cyclic-nucleotide 2'-phosphodiesterase (5'-nucleotidase family)